MSKADRLGSGAAFGAAATARSSRRDVIDSTINGSNASTAALTDVPVTLISDNPDNPRNHLRALDDTVESVRELGVILPIVIGTVEAYLHGRPHRADDLDDGAQYVVIDGHRRLEAARRVGLATIPVRVDNARLATDETLLEAAFVANYHRDDMTELEEAHALKSLVDYYGSQTKASKRLGIPQNTISTKLSLLKLTPELQKDLATGARKVEHVRNLGKLSAEEQVQKADERAEAARDRDRDRPEPPPPGQQSGPADYHGVIIPDSAGSTSRPPAATGSQNVPDPGTSASQNVPEPRTHQTPAPPSPPAAPGSHTRSPQQPKKLPYDDGPYVGQHLAFKMDDDPFFLMLGVLLEKAHQRDATRLTKLLDEATQDAR